jgi:hypothetical protein
MVIPCLFYLFSALFDDTLKQFQYPGVEAAILSDLDLRKKPELSVGIVLDDVDVDRLSRVAFIGEEVETKALPAEHNGHSASPLPTPRTSTAAGS